MFGLVPVGSSPFQTSTQTSHRFAEQARAAIKGRNPSPRTVHPAEEFLSEFNDTLEPIQHRHELAQWTSMAAPGAPEAPERVSNDRAQLFADRAAFSAVCRWLEDVDPISQTGRQLRLYFNQALPLQAPVDLLTRIQERQQSLEADFQAFKPIFEGQPTDDDTLDVVLWYEIDETRRRAAWEASREVGRLVAPRVLELARLRNQQAQVLGYRSYAQLALEMAEIDVPLLDRIVDDLERRTDPVYRDFRRVTDDRLAARFGCSPSALKPWHRVVRFAQQPPTPAHVEILEQRFSPRRIEALLRTTFDALEMPIDSLLEASDLHSATGHRLARCHLIDVPRDVRVQCDVAGGTRWMATALHEFGHAAHAHNVDPELPLLLRTTPAQLSEAVALLMGQLARDPRWLTDVAGVDERTAALAGAFGRQERLAFLRWTMVVVRFEQALFRDPDGDLDGMWYALVERLQGMPSPPRDAPDWASVIHIACYPVYYQFYLLGEVMAGQLRQAAAGRLGSGAQPVDGLPLDRGTGRFLQRLFRPGAMMPWPDALQRATGRPLDTGPLLRELGESSNA